MNFCVGFTHTQLSSAVFVGVRQWSRDLQELARKSTVKKRCRSFCCLPLGRYLCPRFASLDKILFFSSFFVQRVKSPFIFGWYWISTWLCNFLKRNWLQFHFFRFFFRCSWRGVNLLPQANFHRPEDSVRVMPHRTHFSTLASQHL